MTRAIYEFTEAFRIAFAQIRANAMRSVLTALGVIIGIVAVTLMGTAINGIDIGFNRSLALLGYDVLYVQRWPWRRVSDWWNYLNRPAIQVEQAERLNRIFEATPGSLLEVAVPVGARGSTVKAGDVKLGGIMLFGTNADYSRIVTADVTDGRLFNDFEANAGRPVCVLGSGVADNLFPGRPAAGQQVDIRGQHFTVVGVLAKQGEFLGLFSFDNQILVPLNAMRKLWGNRMDLQLRVKVKDKTQLMQAEEELTGAMRRDRKSTRLNSSHT